MRIDLHVHTSPRSPCSNLDPAELAGEAASRGLQGVCLTEHQVVWEAEEARRLSTGGGIRIFRGNEFTTNQGDVLVLGFHEDIKGLLMIQDLRSAVLKSGGFMIAAHPFRGFKTFGIGSLQMTPEQACRRKIFEFVDAIEIGNGKLSSLENDMASQVARILGLPGTAGSDAHRAEEIGRWVMDFHREFETDHDLVGELRAGRFDIVHGHGG
ncbi:MAG: PHP domain protein [Syntrophaceae bacterium PtaU1.Bin231]|nr:MAG: PHP domain protein [Syntrophaceae bacterium PtaU1.Bin231]